MPSTLQTLTALAIRVTGIILGLYALRTAGAYFYGASTNENATAYFWLVMAPMLLLLAASVLMIALPHAIAGKLIPDDVPSAESEGDDTQPVTLAGVEVLAVSLVGLYFLIQAVLDATYIGTLWYATKQFAMQWAWTPQLVATVIAALVEFIAALWLLLGGKGVIGLMRWARTAHPKR